MRSIRNSLRVWSWYSYDPGLDQPVVFAAAAYRPEDLRAVRSRLQLPEPAVSTQLHPWAPGYSEATAAPLRALWMPLEQYAARSSRWRREDQLSAARLRHSAADDDPRQVAEPACSSRR